MVITHYPSNHLSQNQTKNQNQQQKPNNNSNAIAWRRSKVANISLSLQGNWFWKIEFLFIKSNTNDSQGRKMKVKKIFSSSFTKGIWNIFFVWFGSWQKDDNVVIEKRERQHYYFVKHNDIPNTLGQPTKRYSSSLEKGMAILIWYDMTGIV